MGHQWRGITVPEAYEFLEDIGCCRWHLNVLKEHRLSLRYQVEGTVPRRNKDWSLGSRQEPFHSSPALTPGTAIIEAAEWVKAYLEADPPVLEPREDHAETADA